MTTKKKKSGIDLSDESFKALMQETYHEIVAQRNTAITAYKKWSKNTDENTDIAMIGKTCNELLKVVDATLEKKLRLLKIQADVLYKNAPGTGGDDDGGVVGGISDDDKKMVQEMLTKQRVELASDNIKKYE